MQGIRILWRFLLVMFGLFVAMIVAVLTYLNAQGVPEEELIRRCELSQPQWTSYQEDVKGQVGAAPVASWQGEPVRMTIAGGMLTVQFQIEGPWSSYRAALPVLARDPFSRVSRNTGATHLGGGVVAYTFPLTAVEQSAQIPWIELHYPHTERRFPLRDGVWERR